MQHTIYLIALISVLFVTPRSDQDSSTYQRSDEIPMLGAELYGVDQSHSYFGFSIKFLGMSTIKGTFKDYDASILYDEDDMTRTSITLVIDVGSIETGNNWRDRDLQSERFFDAEQHPKIIFQSSRIEESESGFIVHGDLTIRGTTTQIYIPVSRTLQRTVDTGWGNIRIGFEGSHTLNRLDYGVHGGDFWGVQALSEEVEIEFGLLGTIMNMEKISYRSAEKPSIGEVLQKLIDEEGVSHAVDHYQTLHTDHLDDYNFDEPELNKLGYKLLEKGQAEEALEIFKLNAGVYPESSNVYDSLGQVNAMLGEKEQSVYYYQRALSLDPHIPSAMEMIRRLAG